MIRKAVIPAASYRTRFLPVTRSVPKEMLPVVDRPAIQYVVEVGVAFRIQDIPIAVSRGKRCCSRDAVMTWATNSIGSRRTSPSA